MSHPLPVMIGKSSDGMWSDYVEYASIISNVCAPENAVTSKILMRKLSHTQTIFKWHAE